uniref:photosystem I subunit IX n=1 Tax=Salacia menglaensis TaxID=2859576 RepID=UPI0021ABEC38|nr:photosystem I subunit IX [Salacia menglaensis]YP_010458691.1 photosystem I subunit IX [Salacia obovatilimba]UUA69821.1 photosystem I subunit IX [Salacia menglaensis]UUA70173.1 photosystem I subunit IX [Salacia obovatilimba]
MFRRKGPSFCSFKILEKKRQILATKSLHISIGIRESMYKYRWFLITYTFDHIAILFMYYNKAGGSKMRDLKTYLSAAPVLSTLWFGSLAGLLIEINRFFPDALTFPFFSF